MFTIGETQPNCDANEPQDAQGTRQIPCRHFNQGNSVFEVLIRKIKGQSSIIMCSVLLSEAKNECTCFHSQLVKQWPKKSQSFSFASWV